MGKSFYIVRPLEPPVAAVEDRVMFIPRGQELVVEKEESRLLLVCGGQVRLSIDGKPVGEVGPGDVLIVTGPCRQTYQGVTTRAVTRYHTFRIVFDSSQLNYSPSTGWPMQIASQHEITDFTIFIQNRFSKFHHLVKILTPEMHTLMENIRRDAESSTDCFRHRVNARARLLVALIGERVAERDGTQMLRINSDHKHWLVERVKEYLMSHLSEPLTLNDIGRYLHLSAEHVARTFKQRESKTIFAYLTHLRIEKAKVLLNSAHLSIHEIARETGWSSSSLFCRNFKQVTGFTPTSFREISGGQSSISGSVIISNRQSGV